MVVKYSIENLAISTKATAARRGWDENRGDWEGGHLVMLMSRLKLAHGMRLRHRGPMRVREMLLSGNTLSWQ